MLRKIQRHATISFQLIHIALDIVKDTENSRCYLPLTWLEESGLSRDSLADPQYCAVLTQFAVRLIVEAEPYI